MRAINEKLGRFGIELLPEDFSEYELFVYQLVSRLKQLPAESVVLDLNELEPNNLPDGRNGWVEAGRHMLAKRKYNSALVIFEALLEYLYSSDSKSVQHLTQGGVPYRVIPYKGDALRFIAQCNRHLGRHYLADRMMMLALIEEVRNNKREHGFWEDASILNDAELLTNGFSNGETKALRVNIGRMIRSIPPEMAGFPEYILQCIDDYSWVKHHPTAGELLIYKPNLEYIKLWLEIASTKVDSPNGGKVYPGEPLEILAQYLFQMIPGCRAFRRRTTYETDLDVWCQFEGLMPDFRKELGHYCIIECKNWNRPAGFSEIAKFALVLISSNCKFGVMFAREGISGGSGFEDARRCIVKLYQNAGIVITVVDEVQLRRVADGENFIELLRQGYEKTRFDLSPGAVAEAPKKSTSKRRSKLTPA